MKLSQVLAFILISSILSLSAEAQEGITDKKEFLTPSPKPQPRLNNPLVYGCRPSKPFIYRIPCQGTRPIEFSVKGLPQGLSMNSQAGIITGTSPARGEYKLTIVAKNNSGSDKRNFTIVSGDKLSLTPSMGYNHWYAHYDRVTDKMMREAADVMISSGMADAGYDYVNIDDCWMNAPEYKNDPSRVGPLRDEKDNLIPNSHFPDMKALTDYIHAKGLKAGIYISPGPLTCGRFAGSYGHEAQDAKQFSDWGFDFLKYDWCSYGRIASQNFAQGQKLSVEDYKKPYRLMGDILKEQKRDIVYNLCQYGMGDVWKWGGEIGGNSWRTAGDLGFELDRIFDVALKNSEHREFSKPGEWNDPDYIQIGWIGSAKNYGEPEHIPMPASMQYAYMSLWSLMAAPLIYSGDMSHIDDFTLNVLCNPEIIGVDQDPLGESAAVIMRSEEQFIMIKKLYDGTCAVGLFNRSKDPQEVKVNFSELPFNGKLKVRDLWREKDLGKFTNNFTSIIPAQGVVMVKISK